MRTPIRTRQQLMRAQALRSRARRAPSRFLAVVRSLAVELGFHWAPARREP